MHYLITAFVFLLLPLTTSAQPVAEAPDWAAFAAQLKPLAANQTVQADYCQTRHLQSLTFTFEIHGRLYHEHGRRLAWITDTPLHTVTIFTAQTLQQWDAETRQVTAMSSNNMPWLKMIFDYQNQWLSGNLETLSNDFTMTPLDQHTLKLVPRRERLATFFQEIELRFQKDFTAIESVMFKEGNGDFMTITFTNVKNNEPIPEKIWTMPAK